MFEEAAKQDHRAVEIISHAASELRQLVSNALRISQLANCELHLWGGVFKGKFIDPIINEIKKETDPKGITIVNQSLENAVMIFARTFEDREERNSKVLNQYGDKFKPTDSGYGVDISSQRQDELDLNCLNFISEANTSGKKIRAVELGGGFGQHSLNMVKEGASVIMIDIADMAKNTFKKALEKGTVKSKNLSFIQKDFKDLNESDIPENVDLIFSQRSIHYLPYEEATKTLKWLYSRMADKGAIFISAAGWDTEYGKTYPDRNKKIVDRFNFVTPDMQEKHGIEQKIVTYKEEDMVNLLKEAGFSEIKVASSAFGNIKASALKI